MAQNIEKITKRKDNIESIEPLLSALRTISLANWRSALNRAKDLENYFTVLQNIFTIILNTNTRKVQKRHVNKNVLFLIGTNRGLCGSFNQKVIDLFREQKFINDQHTDIYIIGIRLEKFFTSTKHKINKTIVFPDIQEIHNLAQSALSNSSENIESTSFSVIYNKYMGASAYQPSLEIFDPYAMNLEDTSKHEYSDTIIDTDPIQLYNILVDTYFTTSLERCLLSSLAAESSARFANMENAAKNVDELTHELEIIIQGHRRRQITSETQELAVSSGLLGNL